MADFNITIGAQPTPGYTVTQSFGFAEEDCSTLNTTYSLGIIEDTATININYLLSSYTDASAWKTFKLRNVVYSNSTSFYLEHSATKIPEAGATVYDVDIEGVAASTAISGFVIKLDSLTLTTNETITFDLAVENVALDVGAYSSFTILLQKNDCTTTPPPKVIQKTLVGDDTCSEEWNVQVNVPAEGSRYVVRERSDGFGSLPLSETITTTSNYQLYIDAYEHPSIPSSNDTWSDVIIKVYSNSSSTVILDSFGFDRLHTGNVC